MNDFPKTFITPYTIDYAAFEYCNGLTGKIVIPPRVVNISDAFINIGYKELDLVISMNEIPANFYSRNFENTTINGKLILTNGIRYIGENAFLEFDGNTIEYQGIDEPLYNGSNIFNSSKIEYVNVNSNYSKSSFCDFPVKKISPGTPTPSNTPENCSIYKIISIIEGIAIVILIIVLIVLLVSFKWKRNEKQSILDSSKEMLIN